MIAPTQVCFRGLAIQISLTRISGPPPMRISERQLERRKHGNRRRTGLDEPSTLEVVGGRQEVLEVVDLRWMPKSVNSSEVWLGANIQASLIITCFQGQAKKNVQMKMKMKMKLSRLESRTPTSLNPAAPPPDNFANHRIKFRLARGRKTLIDVTQSQSRQAPHTSALSRFSSSPQVEQRPQPRSYLSVDVASLYNRSLDTWKLLSRYQGLGELESWTYQTPQQNAKLIKRTHRHLRELSSLQLFIHPVKYFQEGSHVNVSSIPPDTPHRGSIRAQHKTSSTNSSSNRTQAPPPNSC
ncbi:hypothetical protein BGZ57DRAFT_1005255 [Hyaloscypha finlandica]|nr:hypothetical protein BGZ57DRAFT_1005255 [Hyaloscypha finlandica]